MGLYEPLKSSFHEDGAVSTDENRFVFAKDVAAALGAGIIASVFGNPFVCIQSDGGGS